MAKPFVFLSFLILLLAGCTSYKATNIIPAGPFKFLTTTDSNLSSKAPSQESSNNILSQRWVSYGKIREGELKGFLTIPEGKGPFPTVIFNHGSKQQPEPKRAVIRFFKEQGYVVFLPHRRGYGNSSGPELNEAVSLRLRTDEGKRQLIDRLHQESEDVLTALDYIKGLTLVDSKRIVIAGYSFGGIATMLAAGKSSDFVAGIAFATASGTWRYGGIYRQELINAVREAKVPMLFIYAENDYDLSPGIVFSRELRRMEKPVTLRIYPPFGESEQDAHEMALRPEGIEIWGADVMNFIKRWMP